MLTRGNSIWGTVYDGMNETAKQLKTGDSVAFGSFVPLESSIRVPMLWHVIDKKENKLKLLSYYFFEHMGYWARHNAEKNITWENTDIRYQLNNKYFNECFNRIEKNAILTTEVETATHDSSSIVTYDKLYIPSLKDIENIPEYLKMGRSLAGYEDENDCQCLDLLYCFYWLRDPGEFEDTNYVVQGYSDSGLVLDSLGRYSDEVGVRAVMWIDTEKLEIA